MSPLRGQAGQTAAEYMGVLLVVGVVIAAIAASDIAGTVSDAIARQVCRVASDGPCEPAGDAQRAGRPDGRERPGSGDRAAAEATGLSLGPARVVSGAPARAVTLRPAIADGDAETCFASTTGDCGPTPDGAYELVPPEPTPGEQVDGFLSDLGGDADAWLGWLGGSDPSSPFYDPLAQQRRDGQVETFDDGLAFLEGLNQGPSALGPTGPTGDSGGELANELMGISPLRRAIAGAQEGDDLRSLGELAVLFPFLKGGKAAREGLEEATKADKGGLSRLKTRLADETGSFNPLAPFSSKIERQMARRGWTPEQVNEAVRSGRQVRATNKATGNAATRYVHPTSGQSVVVDDVTGEVIHVGGPGFKYGPESGDVP